jgi:hypothetical protein
MWKGNVVPDFTNALEDYLASLPDEDWQALSARVRPPADNPAGESEPVSPAEEFTRLVFGKPTPTNGDPA